MFKHDNNGAKCAFSLLKLVGLISLTVGLTFIPVDQARADDARARAIMEKVDARDDGDNSTSDMEMILIDKRGSERVRRIKAFRKDFGEDKYSLMFFLSPADVKDTGFLTYDYDDPERDDDQWLYLPALKKVKRIATSDKSGAFMGSDFSYADMTTRNLAEWDFKLLKEATVDGHKVWIIMSTPRSRKIVDRYGYTKSAVFVRQDNYVVIRAKNWVDDGKTKYMVVRKLELIDGIWTSTEIQMTTKRGKQTLHRTIMRSANVKYNQGLDKSIFTTRRLDKGL